MTLGAAPRVRRRDRVRRRGNAKRRFALLEHTSAQRESAFDVACAGGLGHIAHRMAGDLRIPEATGEVDSTPSGASGTPAHLPAPTDQSPPAIPDHTLLQPIAGGSYGEVWLARSTLGTWRAVKMVHRRSFDHDRPYEREFAGLQRYEPVSRSHEHLVDVLQVGRNDAVGYFYYVMEVADAIGSSKGEGRSSKDEVRRAKVEGRRSKVERRSPKGGKTGLRRPKRPSRPRRASGRWTSNFGLRNSNFGLRNQDFALRPSTNPAPYSTTCALAAACLSRNAYASAWRSPPPWPTCTATAWFIAT